MFVRCNGYGLGASADTQFSGAEVSGEIPATESRVPERVFAAGWDRVFSVHGSLDAVPLELLSKNDRRLATNTLGFSSIHRSVIGLLARLIFLTLIVVQPFVRKTTPRSDANNRSETALGFCCSYLLSR